MGCIIDFILLLLLIFAPCKECTNSNSVLSFLGKPANDPSSNGKYKLSFFNDVLKTKRIDAQGNKCISLSEYNYMLDSNGIDVFAKEGITSEGKQYLYPLLETISDAAIKGYRFMISPTSDAKKTVGCFSQQQQQQQQNPNSNLNPDSEPNPRRKQLPKSPKSAVIPLTIHQSWKSKNSVPKTTVESATQQQQYSSLKSSIPPHLSPDFSSVRKNTPEFLYILWTDSDINAFIKHYYPQYRSYYDSLDLNIKKMDFSRYLILYQFGGVYADIDVTIEKTSILSLIFRPSSLSSSSASSAPLDDRLEFISYNPYSLRRNASAKQRRGAKLSSQYENFVGNAFFATIPGSGVLKIMINDIVSFSINSQHLFASRKVDVLNHTGPLGLARAVNSFLDLKFKEPSNNLLYPSKKGFMNNQTYVKILNNQFIGNSNDHPQYVTHYRQHQWGKDAKNLT